MPARILVVEDNVVNQKLMTAILESGGYEVDIAANGAEAVERVAARDYDAILMDVQMPVMDGIEATRRIRAFEQQNGRRHVPIIAVTAHVMKWNRNACLGAGMDDFLSKPVTKRETLTLIEKWLQKDERGTAGDSA